MPQKACNRLNVRSVVQDIHGKRMPGTMPRNMLFDSSPLYPSFNGLAAHFITRQRENQAVFALLIGWLPYQLQKPIVERDNNAAVG